MPTESTDSDPTEESETPIPHDERLGGSVQTGRPQPIETPENIQWQGWLLVAVVVLSFVVVPLFVLFLPEMHWLISAIGFSQRQAYILFPMIPAILLGITAVWATLRSQSP